MFALQTLIVTIILNGLLLATIYFLDDNAMDGQALMLFGIGGLISLVLWGVIQLLAKRAIDAASVAQLANLTSVAPVEQATAAIVPEPELIPEPEPAPEPVLVPEPEPEVPATPSTASAIQMLSILQRKGRLVDFLQEDIKAYNDDQIGAAVRNIHEGCKQALDEHLKLEPIFQEYEGSRVTIPAGFDAYAVQLVGNVTGEPPFNGTLLHRGWRVAEMDLPDIVYDSEQKMVVASAEVEVGR